MKYDTLKEQLETRAKTCIDNVFKTLGKPVDVNKIQFLPQKEGHKSPVFRDGCMYVYSFWIEGEDQPLKIGKAGPRSKARYTSHHYNRNSSESCLAKRIADDADFVQKYAIASVESRDLNEWIRNNCYRINIEMPFGKDGFDLYTLELVEAIMHNLYPPRFEGTSSQQERIDNQ